MTLKVLSAISCAKHHIRNNFGLKPVFSPILKESRRIACKEKSDPSMWAYFFAKVPIHIMIRKIFCTVKIYQIVVLALITFVLATCTVEIPFTFVL